MVELARTYPMPAGVVGLRFLSFFLLRTGLIAGTAFGIPMALGIIGDRLGSDLITDVPHAVDEFLLRSLLVTGIGTGAGFALGWVVRDVFHGNVRRTLDRFAQDPANEKGLPVQWQRRSVRRGRVGPGLATVGIVVLLAGAFLLLVVLELDGIVAWLTAAVAAGVAAVGLLMAVFGLLSRRGPAVDLWGGPGFTPLDPREPGRRFDSDGRVKAPDTRSIRDSLADREALRHGPPALRRSSALWSRSRWFLVLAALAFVLGVVIAWGVAEMDDPPGTAAFAVVLALFAATLVLVAAAAVLSMLGTRRLRQTILDLAAHPDAPAPPWHLLRLVILEEYPLQALTNHLHTLGTLCLAVGITGSSLAHVSEIAEYSTLWALLTTLGGVAWLLHASGWWWRRRVTLEQNQYLQQRWPPEPSANS